MGQKEEEVKRLRVVLDTNVIVSALLFPGKASQLVDEWKSGSIVLLATKKKVLEYLRVLSYPKFELTETEIEVLFNRSCEPARNIGKAVSIIGHWQIPRNSKTSCDQNT